MLRIDASAIDKSLPVPVGTQLHGLLNYLLTSGDIPNNTKIPSVRQLAAELNVAPMTVAQVYGRLRDAGLIEMRQGLGAFTVRDPHGRPEAEQSALGALRGDIAVLIGKAERLGISDMALMSMVNAEAKLRKPYAALRIVFVGIFEGPTEDYVRQIRPFVGGADTIRILTVDALKASQEACREANNADLVLTFLNREAELKALLPEAKILGLRFIPSEQTRRALAGLDPRAQVAAVTHFRDYIAIMRPSVREFAPHISDIRVTWSAAPDLDETLVGCDAVIFASGADHVAGRVQPGIPCFEFRHAPDPGALQTLLVPYLAALRSNKLGASRSATAAA